MPSPSLVLITLLITLSSVPTCLSTRIIFPFTTDNLVTPLMSIGNATEAPNPLNFTSELGITGNSLCNTDGWSPALLEYVSGKSLMVQGFQGCSYEKVGRVAQSIGVLAVIFSSRQRIPIREPTFTNGRSSKDIYIPLLVMGSDDFDMVYNAAFNKTLLAEITGDANPWHNFTSSPAPVVIQMLGAFFSVLWILVAIRGIFFSLRYQGLSHRRGLKVQLARAVLYLEFIANVLRLTLFAADPFLIKDNTKMSWAGYVVLLIINVPITFISCVCFLFLCLLILVPARVLILKAFFVVVTLTILAVDIAAAATSASYKNPRGVDIYTVAFTLDGVEGVLIAIVLGITCTVLLIRRDKQIRYSPRALKRLTILGIVVSVFLIIGAIGSFVSGWVNPHGEDKGWVDVFTLCIEWIGLLGASGGLIASFPKGKRIKKIKVIKVVDNDFARTSHPGRKIVL